MRIDPGNQDASMMLADIMLQKSEWEAVRARPPHHHFHPRCSAAPTDKGKAVP